MIPSWIPRLIAVLTLIATLWFSGSPSLARTVPRQLDIIASDSYTDIPDTAVAGLTLVTLDNRIDIPFGVTLYAVPDSLVAQILGATPVATTEADGTLPGWLAGATAIGGPGIAAPSGRSEAVLDLDLGSYAVVFDLFDPTTGTLAHYLLEYEDGIPFFIDVVDASSDVDSPPTVAAATPTEENDSGTEGPTTTEPTMASEPDETPTVVAEIPDDIATVVMTDDAFVLPASFPIGAQTWEVVNQGQLPHAMIVVAIPPGTTPDQLRVALFPSSTANAAQAAAVAFDTSAMNNVGGLGPLAPGLSAAAALDLAPGTYAVFSALPDPSTGEPDGAQGLLAVFLIG